MDTQAVIRDFSGYLKENQFEIQKNFNQSHFSLQASYYAFKKGYSLWKFFPYEDHVFIHDFSFPAKNTLENLLDVHEKARAYVNSLFKRPKALRIKVPNIITVVFSTQEFSGDMKKNVQTNPYSLVGGEKHSRYLIDLSRKLLYSAGAETTYADFLAVTHKQVNPNNRAYYLIGSFCQKIFTS